MRHFNYKKVAREAAIPTDDMMYELHVLRACMAVRDGYARLEDVPPPEPAAAAPR